MFIFIHEISLQIIWNILLIDSWSHVYGQQQLFLVQLFYLIIWSLSYLKNHMKLLKEFIKNIVDNDSFNSFMQYLFAKFLICQISQYVICI